MAGCAVGGSAIIPVAVNAVSHLQGTHLLDLHHAANIPVTRLTGGRWLHAVRLREEPDVRLMNELDVVGDAVDSDPVDGLVGLVKSTKLFNLRLAVAHGGVTGHAEAHGRNRRCRPCGDVSVAEGAVQSEVVHVNSVWKGYRLIGTLAESENAKGETEPGRDEESGYRDGDNCPGEASQAEHPKKEKVLLAGLG